jgi:hypothetical protein
MIDRRKRLGRARIEPCFWHHSVSGWLPQLFGLVCNNRAADNDYDPLPWTSRQGAGLNEQFAEGESHQCLGGGADEGVGFSVKRWGSYGPLSNVKYAKKHVGR